MDFATAEVFEVAHAVLVLELAVYDVRPDEEFGVAVSAESSAALDAIFVDHAKGTEILIARVVVARKRECVEGV